MTNDRSVLVTGGAGYVGSALTGHLLASGWSVTVADRLDFGGEPLVSFWGHPRFRFIRADLTTAGAVKAGASGLSVAGSAPASYDAVVHLAAIVGFKACAEAGRSETVRTNVEATRQLFDAADAAGVERFVFASTYSNYGIAQDGRPVDERSALVPQSLYAESKIAAECALLQAQTTSRCGAVILRFATLFGISPRTRFDLIINQFVLDALTRGELVVYDRDFTRSFVHLRDVCRSIEIAMTAPRPLVTGEIFNVGGDAGNLRKTELIERICLHVPGTEVRFIDRSIAGDMRDISVSFLKIQTVLGFRPEWTVDQGIIEVRDALQLGIVGDPYGNRYRNAPALTQ